MNLQELISKKFKNRPDSCKKMKNFTAFGVFSDVFSLIRTEIRTFSRRKQRRTMIFLAAAEICGIGSKERTVHGE